MPGRLTADRQGRPARRARGRERVWWVIGVFAAVQTAHAADTGGWIVTGCCAGTAAAAIAVALSYRYRA